MNNWRDEFDKEFYHEHGDEVGNYMCQSLEKRGDRCDCQLGNIKSFIQSILDKQREELITGETSDGYHTFNELYEFRKLYNAALFNEWANQKKYNVHKSTRHHDGEACFGGGWFIVMATLPTGQISNHYEMKDWDLFQCDIFTKANEWDGHTAKDVAKRLNDLLTKLEEE